MKTKPVFNLGAWRTVEEEIRRIKEEQRNAPEPAVKPYLSLHADAASFLFHLALATSARSILEIGTNAGYSALWLARACAVTGGKVLTLEKEAAFADIAREYFERASVASWVQVHVGDARQFLRDARATWDMAFIDAAKDEYVAYAQGIWPHLKPGGSLLADNISSHAEATRSYVEYVSALGDAHTLTTGVGLGIGWTIKNPGP